MNNTVLNIVINIVLQLTMIALIFWLAYRFGWKKFTAYITRRQEATMAVAREAEELKVEAVALHEEAELRMKEINKEASEIIVRAEETASKVAKERKEKLEAELERSRALEEKQLANDRKRLEQQMEVEVIEKATDLAAQFITSNANEASTEQQIASFLEKMGDE